MPAVTPLSPMANLTFYDYMQFRIGKLFFEIWPWYWGVYKWLGLTLPPLVLKVITRIGLLSGVGILLYFMGVCRERRADFLTKAVVFSVISVSSYLLYLLLWDFRLMQSAGFSAGLQGRYFFSNVVPEMLLLITGFSALSGVLKRKWELVGFWLTPVLMLVLNFISLFVLARSYYSLNSLQLFINQVSQYKPWYFKGNAIIFLLTIFVFLSVLYIGVFSYLTVKKWLKNS